MVRCLVLDHDDTVVDSTAHVHFPAFLGCAQVLRPGMVSMTLEEYFRMNWEPGLGAYYRDVMKLTDAEMEFETKYWLDYVASHVPVAYAGMGKLIREQKRRGGLVCVVSHSRRENILRDYEANDLPLPDLIYGSELPSERQKPDPWPLLDLMERLELAPSEVLMVDDLPLGREMARRAGVAFAAAGWAHAVPEIEAELRRDGGLYFSAPEELYSHLFG